MSQTPLFFLMGATATGKTDLALELVQQYPFEIISVDSTLIYKDMDIGTAKPSAAIRQQVPHHLIDIIEADQHYSAMQFIADAKQAMATIQAKGKIPLLVGGTMLYFKALQQGLSDLPPHDPKIRQQLENTLAQEGLHALHQQLQHLDPDSAVRLHPNDRQRIIRALEIKLATGQSWHTLCQQNQPQPLENPIVSLALTLDRQQLHHRLEQRFLKMLEQGFVDEVKHFYQQKQRFANTVAMRAVGYRQVWDYLEGSHDYDSMIAKSLAASRQLAKRQCTWLKPWQNCRFFECDDLKLIPKVCDWIQKAL